MDPIGSIDTDELFRNRVLRVDANDPRRAYMYQFARVCWFKAHAVEYCMISQHSVYSVALYRELIHLYEFWSVDTFLGMCIRQLGLLSSRSSAFCNIQYWYPFRQYACPLNPKFLPSSIQLCQGKGSWTIRTATYSIECFLSAFGHRSGFHNLAFTLILIRQHP